MPVALKLGLNERWREENNLMLHEKWAQRSGDSDEFYLHWTYETAECGVERHRRNETLEGLPCVLGLGSSTFGSATANIDRSTTIVATGPTMLLIVGYVKSGMVTRAPVYSNLPTLSLQTPWPYQSFSLTQWLVYT